MKPTCAKCGSENIIPNAHVRDASDFADGHASVIVEGPRRITAFDPVRVESRLLARVCGDCGYTELTVENPKALLQAYRKIGN